VFMMSSTLIDWVLFVLFPGWKNSFAIAESFAAYDSRSAGYN
jgi:hypothetical protein